MHRFSLPLLGLLFCLPAPLHAQDGKPAKKKTREKPDINAMAYAGQYHWADWVEPDFPFFSSVLDARDLGADFPKDNLTPRGLILNLGHNMWACFDTDLLRIACIWQGEEGKLPITSAALAPGSYHIAGQKTKDGEDDLPHINGTPWLANGLYAGWQVLKSPDDKPSFTDPRSPAPDKEELGRGPLDATLGRFKGVRIADSKTTLEYEVAGVAISQTVEVLHDDRDGSDSVQTTFRIAPHENTLSDTVGYAGKDTKLFTPLLPNVRRSPRHPNSNMQDFLVFGPEKKNIQFGFSITSHGPSNAAKEKKASPPAPEGRPDSKKSADGLWPQTVTTKGTLSNVKDAYVVDDIPLPLDNPWKRNVRLADLAFLNDQGDAVAIAFDGDVWKLSGLKGDLQNVTWKRFASGLHEPMSIVVRNGEIFAFDRDGIWRLKDTKGTGEADVYEMFCNRFSQTAETREFPNSMKLAPDGSFIISKGGQEGSHVGKDNGTVIRVSPDGEKFDVIGWGLRQPFAGVNPKTGLVTASDQEGNYVPTTPIHIIRDHQFYGHLATIQPHEQYPQTIAEPLTWIPHPVVASGATQTWLYGAKMGAINDEMVLISYNKPELFRVLMNERAAKPQAAVVGWIHNLDFPTLNAAVNPADGQLYAIGFQVWGTTVKRISGLARIRYTGEKRVLLLEAAPMDKGVLLRFNEPLDPKFATDVTNYSVERWNYKRTFKYGSPHLKQDGSPGQEWMPPSSAYLSKDGQSVFIGIPDMKTGIMQMRVGYGLKGADGLPARNNAYFTPYDLAKFQPEKEGFEKMEVDLTPRKVVAVAAVKPTKEEGERLYQMMGCMACHSVDGTLYGKVGPSWKGLYGSERILAKGGDKAIANDDYIRESIMNPSAKIVKGFEKMDTGMPIYAGVLNDSQIDSLILYIKSLK